MPKPDVLEHVKLDIDADNFEKARNHLLGLISARPDDLELRSALGDVYAAQGDRVRAGLFWYLARDKTDAMLDACTEFERACGKRSTVIAERLRYDGDIDAVPCVRARRMLRSLKHKQKKHEDWVRSVVNASGCLLLALALLGIIAFILYAVMMSMMGQT